jgi:alpha-glucosidase
LTGDPRTWPLYRENYTTSHEGQPGFDFIRQVPSTWNETRVLSGQVGDYLVVARLNGSDWYLGAMTDWTPRALEVPLSFLSAGRYQIETWADVPDSTDLNQLAYEKKTVEAGGKLVLRLNSGGGQAMRIRPVKE